MASSSSSPYPFVPASSSRSWKYDVFLSFRGEDTRKTFVDHLYSALVDRLVCTYKDDETLLRGDTISPSLLKAIEESQIAIIIFSKNYAHSSWCLDELEYIMKCKEERGLTVLPIFYHVEPTNVRKQKRKYEEAFAKHESEINNIKVESWRKTLVAAGTIAGWEINHNDNGCEAKCIKDIVGTVLDKLLYLNSVVDENLVGMGTRLRDLKSLLDIGSDGVRMIGIWGIGGGGKTTLASSLYIEVFGKFDSCCFLENIKEESNMKTLQGKILSTVLKTEVNVPSVDIGKHMIKSRLGRRNVLIVLDDIDDRKQLETLAGSPNWYGDGSRIVITTRNEHLLRTHKVDEVYNVSLLSHDEAFRLFNKHAYNEKNPLEDYKMLSQRVVSYAAGLPLALIVLGSFLYDKDKNEWNSTLDRLKDIPEMEIVKILKISYDGLTPLEKELFLDIACFYIRRMEKDEAMEILEACGFHPGIGVKVLIQKSLITINPYGQFDMHDLIQEMGHYIVRGEHPNNPEKHTRLWRKKEIKDMCYWNTTMENNKNEAIQSYNCPTGFGKFLSKAKKLRFLFVENFDKGGIEVPDYLSNELRYLYCQRYPASPFPESFQLLKLVVLKLTDSLQEELWRGYKYLPCLKELHLSCAYNLARTPDFGGLPCLEKLTLRNCGMKAFEIACNIGELSNLQELDLSDNEFSRLNFSLLQLTRLKLLNLERCWNLVELPQLPTSIAILKADGCRSLELDVGDIIHPNCKWLCQVSLCKWWGRSGINGGERLLQYMLQGNAIENGCMILRLEGDEITKGFIIPRLVKGNTYLLDLPDNWYIHFSGFLFSAILRDNFSSKFINMNHEKSGSTTGMDSQQDVYWKESFEDVQTWVFYVSFGALKHTTWWDPTSTAIGFSLSNEMYGRELCNGFGVRLVSKTIGSQLQTTADSSSQSSNDYYKCGFNIKHDSKSELKCSFDSKHVV